MQKWANNTNLMILWATITILSGCATQQIGSQSDLNAGPAAAVLSAYRGPLNSLSGVRGSQCPMFPSCSEYMRQAIEKHGAAKGWVMGTERLMRCGHEDLRQVKTVRIKGVNKIYDPLDHNDFWWAESAKSQPNTHSSQ